MKIFALIVSTLFINASLSAQTIINKDTSKFLVPEMSYSKLDSVIKERPFTAIYFWPTWCAPCIAKLPKIIEIFSAKKSISLLLINDAGSARLINKYLINYPEVVKGVYRMEGIAPRSGSLRNFIRLNDMEQVRYFNNHFTHETKKRVNERNPAFFLFDNTGKLLYVNKTLLEVDSVKSAVAGYE